MGAAAEQRGWAAEALRTLTLGTYVGALQLLVASFTLCCYRMWSGGLTDPLGLALAAILTFATCAPLAWSDKPALQAYIRSTREQAGTYFPVRVVVEGELAPLCSITSQTQ